ncbi:MAG: translation initiation factor IF-2 subunit alpha [Candidatus Altiarchaeota archaeon]
MAYENPGYPEEGELIMGSVESIFKQGAFIKLDEYPGRKGMLHLSEISLKWVRNIRDYVKEDQKVVLVVLKTNPERGHIDLSLRRVSEHQKKNKLQEVKQLQRAKKLLNILAEELKVDLKEVEEKIAEKIFGKFDTLYEGFEAIVSEPQTIESFGFPKTWIPIIKKTVEKNITSPYVYVKGFVELKNYAPNGVTIIKDTLQKIQKYKSESEIEVATISAPYYRIQIKAKDYKSAEKTMKNSVEDALVYFKKNQGDGIFHKEIPKK